MYTLNIEINNKTHNTPVTFMNIVLLIFIVLYIYIYIYWNAFSILIFSPAFHAQFSKSI